MYKEKKIQQILFPHKRNMRLDNKDNAKILALITNDNTIVVNNDRNTHEMKKRILFTFFITVLFFSPRL